MVARMNHSIAYKLKQAAEAIDQRGTPGEGSNKQAEFDATAHTVPGYYPGEKVHYIGVDVTDEWIHSASLSVQCKLVEHGLMTNSFRTGEFTGYGDDNTHLEHDYLFHVVPLGWLPDREGPEYE
jgi:hypothetical protein